MSSPIIAALRTANPRGSGTSLLVTIALVAGVLTVTACGGDASTSATQDNGNSQGSAATAVRGPIDLAANLAFLVQKDHPELTRFKADCPPEPTPPEFPVECSMTAIDTSKLSNRNVPDGQHRPVSGTATINGVYKPTRTYIYGLEYAPANDR